MSSLLENWSDYITSWRKAENLSKAQFCEEANIDRRTLRDLEGRKFRSRFYSVAASAEFIRHSNIRKMLIQSGIRNPDPFIPLIDQIEAMPPAKQKAFILIITKYCQLLNIESTF